MHLELSYHQEFTDLIEKHSQKLLDMDGIGKQLDISRFSKAFFAAGTTADASVDANANVSDTSNVAYTAEAPKPMFRLNSYYMVWKHARKLFGKAVADKMVSHQIEGDIYINDFHGIAAGSPYCFNYSSYDIMLGGLTMDTRVKSFPPKYLYSFKSQLEQFVIIASNSTLGATGLADLLIVLSLYARRILRDKKDSHFTFADEEACWKYIEETLVSFIYTVNFPLRANQSPFVNLSIYSQGFLENMVPGYLDPETGEAADIELVQKLQRLYCEIMNTELRRTPLTFPVTTACFDVDDHGNISDERFLNEVAELNLEFGFINIYCGKSSTLSSCCRLRSETDNEYFNSFGAGSTKIGSLGVVTVNLPRLAYVAMKHRDPEFFFSLLEEEVKLAQRINHVKRSIVKKRVESGNLPLYTLGFMDLNKQYSTVGVNGLNEAMEILGYDILTEEGQSKVLRTLDTINAVNDALQKTFKAPHNCEQVPGESVSIKLAAKDRLLGYNKSYNIYSNQFIPLTTKASLLDRIKLQGMFDKHFSGGAICHLNVEQKITDPSTVAALIKKCAKSGVVYFAINYNIQRCESGHMSVGRGSSCVICGGKITDNFTRVVGFLSAVKNWHKVRREEDYPERQFYEEVK